jgi:Family of unknown function (DUF5335)
LAEQFLLYQLASADFLEEFMSKEIERDEWKDFFAGLTYRLANFETSIQILSDDSGAQYLNEGLPLVGITFDGKGNKIEIIVGSGKENHQTHNVFAPRSVAFEDAEGKSGGMLDIEEEDGTKTLVMFSQSLPAVVEHSENESISQVSNAS